MAKPVVVLFDIDETLIHTGGSGARSWNAAFEKLYGIPADIGAHTSAGETDPQVGRATFKGVLHRDPSDEDWTASMCSTSCNWPTTPHPLRDTGYSPEPNGPSRRSQKPA